MLPYNVYIWIGVTAGLAMIPVATTYPGVDLPPWVGLLLALLAIFGGVVLKQMAPADDVHKDSDLPAPAPSIDTDALVAALLPALTAAVSEDQERRRLERIRPIREVATDNVRHLPGGASNG